MPSAEAEKFFADFKAEYGEARPSTRTRSTATRRWRWRWTCSRRAGRQGQRPRARWPSSCSSTKNRQSVLGTYSIDENGDTTLTDYGLYVIEGGEPTYSKKIVKADRA